MRERIYLKKFLLLLLLTAYPWTNVQGVPLKVGFIGGLSGPSKAFGEACRNGFEMGIEKSGTGEISTVYFDDQFTMAETVSGFRKLTEIDHVDVVLALGSSSAKAIAPLAEQKRIPLIAWASDAEVARGRKYVIRSWPSGETEGKRMAEVALRVNRGPFALLVATSDYAHSVGKGMREHLPEGKLLFDDEYPPDARDFRPFLLRAKSRGVNSLAVCLVSGQFGIVARQLRDLRAGFALFGCEGMHDYEEVKISEGALLGSWFITARIDDRFRSEYRRRFRSENVISGAAIYHDVAILLAERVERQRPADEIVEQVMIAGTRVGAVGTYTVRRAGTLPNTDQYFDIQLVAKKIVPDGFELLSAE